MVEPAIVVPKQPFGDPSSSCNDDMAPVEEQQQQEQLEADDSTVEVQLPQEESWWRLLAEEVLDPSDSDLALWSQISIDQFYSCLTRKYYRQQISDQLYFRSCSVVFLFKLLTTTVATSSDTGFELQELYSSPVKALWKCVSGRLATVLERISNADSSSSSGEEELGSDHKTMGLADCVLPPLDPTDLKLVGVNLDDDDDDDDNGIDDGKNDNMKILIRLVDLLEQVMVVTTRRHQQSSGGPHSVKRVRQQYMKKTPKEWKVAVTFLLGFISYDYCQIRLWDTLKQVTFQWTKCFNEVNYLDRDAGLALLGLEILSSPSTAVSETISTNMEGLTPSVVTDLLSGLSESPLGLIHDATGLEVYPLRARCCEELLAFQWFREDNSEDAPPNNETIRACLKILEQQSALAYLDVLDKKQKQFHSQQQQKQQQQPSRTLKKRKADEAVELLHSSMPPPASTLPGRFLKNNYPLDIHLIVLLMNNQLTLAVEIVGRMERMDMSIFDHASKCAAWKRIFEYLLQNGQLYLDQFQSLDHSSIEYRDKRDLLLFGIVPKLGVCGKDTLVEFHKVVLQTVWANPQSTPEEKRYLLLATQKTLLKCFVMLGHDEGVNEYRQIEWPVDTSGAIIGYNGNSFATYHGMSLPPPPSTGGGLATAEPQKELVQWIVRFYKTENPIPESLLDDETSESPNLMRLLTPEPPPPLLSVAEDEYELPQVPVDAQQQVELSIENNDPVNPVVEGTESYPLLVDGRTDETVQEEEIVVDEAEDVDVMVVIDDDDDDVNGNGDELQRFINFAEDVDEIGEEEEEEEEEEQLDDDDDDDDDHNHDNNRVEVFDVGDDPSADERQEGEDVEGTKSYLEDAVTRDDVVELLDSSPEKYEESEADYSSRGEEEEDEDEEEDRIEEEEEDGGNDPGDSARRRVHGVGDDSSEDQSSANGSIDGSSVDGRAHRREEKGETEVAAVGRDFGDTTEEEEEDDRGGKANRAALADREADVRAGSKRGYSSQLEEGYEPEDSQAYTEEEVSEAIHTEDEEEERRQQSLLKNGKSNTESSLADPQMFREVDATSGHNVLHSDDMDAADEHTEEEVDLGAESSELEEAPGPRPLFPVQRDLSLQSDDDQEPDPISLSDFAQSAMRQHRAPVPQPKISDSLPADDPTHDAPNADDIITQPSALQEADETEVSAVTNLPLPNNDDAKLDSSTPADKIGNGEDGADTGPTNATEVLVEVPKEEDITPIATKGENLEQEGGLSEPEDDDFLPNIDSRHETGGPTIDLAGGQIEASDRDGFKIAGPSEAVGSEVELEAIDDVKSKGASDQVENIDGTVDAESKNTTTNLVETEKALDGEIGEVPAEPLALDENDPIGMEEVAEEVGTPQASGTVDAALETGDLEDVVAMEEVVVKPEETDEATNAGSGDMVEEVKELDVVPETAMEETKNESNKRHDQEEKLDKRASVKDQDAPDALQGSVEVDCMGIDTKDQLLDGASKSGAQEHDEEGNDESLKTHEEEKLDERASAKDQGTPDALQGSAEVDSIAKGIDTKDESLDGAGGKHDEEGNDESLKSHDEEGKLDERASAEDQDTPAELERASSAKGIDTKEEVLEGASESDEKGKDEPLKLHNEEGKLDERPSAELERASSAKGVDGKDELLDGVGDVGAQEPKEDEKNGGQASNDDQDATANAEPKEEGSSNTAETKLAEENVVDDVASNQTSPVKKAQPEGKTPLASPAASTPTSRKHPPGYPKNAVCAYNYFVKQEYHKLHEAGMEPQGCIETLTTRWREMSDDDRLPFSKLAEDDKERHDNEIKEWEAKHPMHNDEHQQQEHKDYETASVDDDDSTALHSVQIPQDIGSPAISSLASVTGAGATPTPVKGKTESDSHLDQKSDAEEAEELQTTRKSNRKRTPKVFLDDMDDESATSERPSRARKIDDDDESKSSTGRRPRGGKKVEREAGDVSVASAASSTKRGVRGKKKQKVDDDTESLASNTSSTAIATRRSARARKPKRTDDDTESVASNASNTVTSTQKKTRGPKKQKEENESTPSTVRKTRRGTRANQPNDGGDDDDDDDLTVESTTESKSSKKSTKRSGKEDDAESVASRQRRSRRKQNEPDTDDETVSSADTSTVGSRRSTRSSRKKVADYEDTMKLPPVAENEEPDAEIEELPKKRRGRPPKKLAEEPVSEEEPQKKRGRPAKKTAEELVSEEEVPQKKRGRPAKKKTEEAVPAEKQKKPRGRPRKKT